VHVDFVEAAWSPLHVVVLCVWIREADKPFDFVDAQMHCPSHRPLRGCLVCAGEVLSERLSVRPLSAGWLRVLGVSWVLAGTAEGYVEFDIKGRRRKRPKGDRCAHSTKRQGLRKLQMSGLYD
jgi:hypothetical protein